MVDHVVDSEAKLLPKNFAMGASIRRLRPSPEVLYERMAASRLPSASCGKLVLLVALATAVENGLVDLNERVSRDGLKPVADAGLWWHLSQTMFSVGDLAKLVGTVSDNLATNALVTRLGGIAAVNKLAAPYGVGDVVLHDFVRARRGPEHPPTLSTGSSAGYVDLWSRLWAGSVTGDAVAGRVLGWLMDSMDLSLVPAGFGLDPLAHHDADRGLRVINKTGSDVGLRADTGLVLRGESVYVYAVLANWRADATDVGRDAVLTMMRNLGVDHMRD